MNVCVFCQREKRGKKKKRLDMGHEKQKNKTKSMKEIEKVSGFRVKVCVCLTEREIRGGILTFY